MFQKPDRLCIDERVDHVAQHGSYRIESLVGLADVSETQIVKQDLLDDKDGHRLGQLRASLHDPETKGDNLGREQEVDDIRVVILLCDVTLISDPGTYCHQVRMLTLTSAPITPSEVSRRYSNGLVLLVVFKKG